MSPYGLVRKVVESTDFVARCDVWFTLSPGFHPGLHWYAAMRGLILDCVVGVDIGYWRSDAYGGRRLIVYNAGDAGMISFRRPFSYVPVTVR